MAAKTGRTGLIAKKLGMSRLFNEDGSTIPVTLLHVDNVRVIAKRSAEKDGYEAVQIGIGVAKPKNVSKANKGHFAKAAVEAPRNGVEFRVAGECIPGIVDDALLHRAGHHRVGIALQANADGDAQGIQHVIGVGDVELARDCRCMKVDR